MQPFDATTLVGLLAIVVLLGLSAFFSASEIAIFSLERHRLTALVSSEDPRAGTLGRLRENPHRLLVTILVGNNVVNIAMASIATLVLTRLLGPGPGVAASTLGMSFLVLIVGEITPKSYGVANSESLSLSVAGTIARVQQVLYPVVVVFDVISRGINRLTGGGQEIEKPYVTRDQIEDLLETGERVGDIDESEREMVQGVFDLSHTRAKEIMVPRVNVVAVDATSSLESVLDTCAERRVTRLPVYDGTLDQIVGIADIRDVERAIRQGLSLREIVTEPLQVPDTIEIDDLLSEMQAERVSMAIVRDEFGEMEGVLTVEDILEEIVGEIFEVGEERLIRPTADGLLVKGEATVDEVNDALGTDVPTAGDFETVAGLVNAELGRLGDVGDRIEIDGVTFTVESVDGTRIRRVRVHRLANGPPRDTESDDSDVPS
ncbi:hemolysin family protein [Salinirubrum litoreum]|uniref:Hemolysin family protein n=1 Tax=Salinirubrum litoreum TaxID=1126234 RepID=A0ABD5REJ3_9EURY|nr:hemolysin family protein [Salinirubrum litoreum]